MTFDEWWAKPESEQEAPLDYGSEATARAAWEAALENLDCETYRHYGYFCPLEKS